MLGGRFITLFQFRCWRSWHHFIDRQVTRAVITRRGMEPCLHFGSGRARQFWKATRLFVSKHTIFGVIRWVKFPQSSKSLWIVYCHSCVNVQLPCTCTYADWRYSFGSFTGKRQQNSPLLLQPKIGWTVCTVQFRGVFCVSSECNHV